MTVRRQSLQAFTLVEVMLAMTIGMVVILLAISLLGRSQDDYERISGGVGAEREARAVLNQLTADLQAARFHQDTRFETSTADWPSDRLGFFSLQAPEAQTTAGYLGDLCAIQYYLKDLLIEGRTVRCLMRGFRDSNETFAALRKGEVATLFTPTERDEPVAFGVLAFSARPKTRTAKGIWEDWVKSPTIPPDALELHLTIARRELVARLTTTAAWDGGGKGARAVTKRNLEVYSSVIRFGNPTAIPQIQPP